MTNNRNTDKNSVILAYDPIWAGVISIIGFIPWLIGTLVGFIGGNKHEYLTGDKSTAKKIS